MIYVHHVPQVDVPKKSDRRRCGMRRRFHLRPLRRARGVMNRHCQYWALTQISSI